MQAFFMFFNPINTLEWKPCDGIIRILISLKLTSLRQL